MLNSSETLRRSLNRGLGYSSQPPFLLPMTKSWKKTDLFCAGLAFILPLLLYAYTLCPTVPVGDGGELTCAAHSLGIAHPTGYPLFCLWGRAYIMALPLGSVAVRVNLMSAFFASLAAFVVYLLARELYRSVFPDKPLPARLMALFAALIFSFSETMWSQAVQSEVYALHVFLVAALILVTVLWRRTTDGQLAYLWAFLWGLSFTNHTSVVFLLGAGLYLVISQWRRLGLKRCLVGMALFFVLGISLYLYLPLRSAANPPHDWGNPANLRRLWDHITARQYRQFFLFTSPVDVWNNLRHYVRLLADQFGLPLLALSLVGAVLQGARWRGLFLLFALAGLGNVLLAASYNIPDIEAYYLPSYLIFSLWLGLALALGLRWVLSRGGGSGRRFAAVAMLAALAAMSLVRNFSRASQRGVVIARDYGLNILSSVESDAILFTSADNEDFPTMYLHDVEGVRPDISLFNLASNLGRMRRFLGLSESLREENPALLRRMVVERTHRPVYFTKEHMSMRTDPLQIDDLNLMPFGLVYLLKRKDGQTLKEQLPWSRYREEQLVSSRQFRDYRARMMVANYHLSKGEDLWIREDTTAALREFALARAGIEDVDKASIHNSMGVFFRRIGWLEGAGLEYERALICHQKTRKDQSVVHVNRGNLYADQGRIDLAHKEMERALAIWPGNQKAQFNLARLRANEYMKRDQVSQAAAEFEKMLALDPDNSAVCYNLGVIYGQGLQKPLRAIECFRRCLAIDPQGAMADDAKAQMQRLERQMKKQ